MHKNEKVSNFKQHRNRRETKSWHFKQQRNGTKKRVIYNNAKIAQRTLKTVISNNALIGGKIVKTCHF